MVPVHPNGTRDRLQGTYRTPEQVYLQADGLGAAAVVIRTLGMYVSEDFHLRRIL
jgi:hypothetical protein